MIDPERPVQQYKGVWLPKEILDNPDLTPTEKILLAIIESLDDEEAGGCYASNEYLGNRLGVTEKMASWTISNLKKKGYLAQTKFDGRRRFIRSALSFSWRQTPGFLESGSRNPGVSKQGLEQGSDIKEDNKEGNFNAGDLESEVRMKPSVLFTKMRTFFPRSRNDNRKKQIEAVERLQSEFDLSDETILDGTRALSKKGAWNIDGTEIPITLSALLLADDLSKTAKKLMVFAESGTKEKKYGGPSNVD